MIIQYQTPATDGLQRLKDALGYTCEQMADLAGVSSDVQWHSDHPPWSRAPASLN